MPSPGGGGTSRLSYRHHAEGQPALPFLLRRPGTEAGCETENAQANPMLTGGPGRRVRDVEPAISDVGNATITRVIRWTTSARAAPSTTSHLSSRAKR